MSEMVERVARAICKAGGRDPDARTGYVETSNPPHYVTWLEATIPAAIDAITAIREPTKDMAKSGYGYDMADTAECAANTWHSMIDEALK